MTNYDRWKLDTPDYLEDDEDDRAISGVHSESSDEQDGSDVQQHVQPDPKDAGQEPNTGDQKKATSGEGHKRQEIWTVDGPG